MATQDITSWNGKLRPTNGKTNRKNARDSNIKKPAGSTNSNGNIQSSILEWVKLKHGIKKNTCETDINDKTQMTDTSNESKSLTITIDNLELHINSSWRERLKDEFTKEYFMNIKSFLNKCPSFFPPLENIFTFTHFFKMSEVKVVIIGQDPYHNDGQAMGLSFSVPASVRVPPSLQNIYKEIETDIGVNKDRNVGDLTPWAEQGVLLLNDVLTVTKNKPRSHGGIGWETFTTRILEIINKSCANVVFMLWGRHAQTKAAFLDKKRHLVLASAHPSPFSAHNFLGCKHFSKANEYLQTHGKVPIKW